MNIFTDKEKINMNSFFSCLLEFENENYCIPRINFIFSEEDKNDIYEYFISKSNHTTHIEEICNKYINSKEECEYNINIKNAKEFFYLLNCYYEEYKNVFKSYNDYRIFKQGNILVYLFMRLSYDDVNDINNFLIKQIKMLNDSSVKHLNNLQYIDTIPFLNNYNLNVMNRLSNCFDEASFEIVFNLTKEESINLPLIRYGIYESNGKKVCHIGSIQNKENKTNKELERRKYKINEGVDPENDIIHVEPKKVIAMLLFIFLMHENGIDEFETSGLQLLDYDFHILYGEYLDNIFKKEYPNGLDETKELYSYDYDNYNKLKNQRDNSFEKEDYIIKDKTEKLYLLIERCMYHINGSKITSYPDEVDSRLHFTIPKESELSINGNYANELFNSIHERYKKVKYDIYEDIEDIKNGKVNIKKLKYYADRRDPIACFLLGIIYNYNLFGTNENYIVGNKYLSMCNDFRCNKLLHCYDKNDVLFYREILDKIDSESNLMEKTLDKICFFTCATVSKDIDIKTIITKLNSFDDDVCKSIIYELINKLTLQNYYNLDEVLSILSGDDSNTKTK